MFTSGGLGARPHNCVCVLGGDGRRGVHARKITSMPGMDRLQAVIATGDYSDPHQAASSLGGARLWIRAVDSAGVILTLWRHVECPSTMVLITTKVEGATGPKQMEGKGASRHPAAPRTVLHSLAQYRPKCHLDGSGPILAHSSSFHPRAQTKAHHMAGSLNLYSRMSIALKLLPC